MVVSGAGGGEFPAGGAAFRGAAFLGGRGGRTIQGRGGSLGFAAGTVAVLRGSGGGGGRSCPWLLCGENEAAAFGGAET